MSESVSDGPRSEYLARIRRFTDEMLDRLNQASREKDADENQIRALRNVVLKVFRLWDKALLDGQRDPQLEERIRRLEKQGPGVKNGET